MLLASAGPTPNARGSKRAALAAKLPYLAPLEGACALLRLRYSSPNATGGGERAWNVSCSTARSWQLHEHWLDAGTLRGVVAVVVEATNLARHLNLSISFDDLSLVPFPNEDEIEFWFKPSADCGDRLPSF